MVIDCERKALPFTTQNWLSADTYLVLGHEKNRGNCSNVMTVNSWDTSHNDTSREVSAGQVVQGHFKMSGHSEGWLKLMAILIHSLESSASQWRSPPV